MEFFEGSDGTYLNLQVDNSTKVPCKIYQCKGDLFDRCMSCDSIPETLYRLMCVHKVCEDCLYAGETHVCRACSLKTATEKVAEQTPEKNTGLDALIMQCPVCPTIFLYLKFMKAHILSEHQDKLEDLAKLQQGVKQEHANSGTYQHPYKRLYTDLKSSDFPEDHVQSSSKRVQHFQECEEQATGGSYAEHHKTSTEEEARKKREAILLTKLQQDSNERSKRLAAAVTDMEKRLEGFEDSKDESKILATEVTDLKKRLADCEDSKEESKRLAAVVMDLKSRLEGYEDSKEESKRLAAVVMDLKSRLEGYEIFKQEHEALVVEVADLKKRIEGDDEKKKALVSKAKDLKNRLVAEGAFLKQRRSACEKVTRKPWCSMTHREK